MRHSAILLVLAIAGLSVTATTKADTGTGIDSGPSGVITDTTPTFTFSSGEPGGRFECRVAGSGQPGAWDPCASPHTLSLAEGEYTFFVRAIDRAGNVDPTPASRAFTVDSGVVDTTIDAGPDGATRDTTPTFTFASATKGASFECRLDGPGSPLPAFAGCSAPFVLPAVRSGAYVLHVRALAPGGGADRTPARREFSVDADAPDTRIVAGPAEGAQAPAMSTFRYAASEPGARFECRLGGDPAAWKSCPAAGYTASKLTNGDQVFEVRAIDAVGNDDPTPARRAFTVRQCEPVVRMGAVEARAACLIDMGTPDRPKWVSEGEVKLNGLALPVPRPAKVVLEAPGDAASGPTLSISNITLSVEGVKLFSGSLSWQLPAGDGGEVFRRDLSGLGETLLGMPVAGDVSLRLEKRGERYVSVFKLVVALPEVFRTGKEADAGGVRGEVEILADDAGVHLDGVKIEVANAYIGTLGVKSICLSYVAAGGGLAACPAPRIGNGPPRPFLECATDRGVDRWDGAVAIVLPTATRTELGLWGGLAGGRLSHAGASVDRLGTLVPLAPGVFLERVALGVCLEPPPFQIKGQAAITFGPSFDGRAGVTVDGTFHYRDAYQGSPWMIRAEGGLTLFDQRVASAYFQYQSTGLIDFGFDAQLAFGPASIRGGVHGWVETQGQKRFNVNGLVVVCVDGLACAQAEAVLSSAGAAGCITVTVMSVPVLVKNPDWTWFEPWKVHWESAPVTVTGGLGYTWQTRKLDVMIGSCSIGRWQIARPARASQTAAPREFDVAPGQTAVSFQVQGVGAPPKVLLTGPDGRRIESPAAPGGAFVKDSHLLSEDPRGATTTVMVARPAAGRWRVETLPGSAAIADVRRADALPEPAVAGGVGGRGYERRLGYSFAPQPGQRITFVERGPRTQQTLGVARAGRCARAPGGRDVDRAVRCGRLRFTPGAGPAGRRTIEALVEQDGRPRKAVVIARYTAPPWRQPAAPRRVRLRRAGRDVVVRWARSGNAERFDVVATIGDGRRLLLQSSARARRVRIPRVRRADAVRIQVRGIRLDGTTGPQTSARLKPRRSR